MSLAEWDEFLSWLKACYNSVESGLLRTQDFRAKYRKMTRFRRFGPHVLIWDSQIGDDVPELNSSNTLVAAPALGTIPNFSSCFSSTDSWLIPIDAQFAGRCFLLRVTKMFAALWLTNVGRALVRGIVSQVAPTFNFGWAPTHRVQDFAILPVFSAPTVKNVPVTPGLDEYASVSPRVNLGCFNGHVLRLSPWTVDGGTLFPKQNPQSSKLGSGVEFKSEVQAKAIDRHGEVKSISGLIWKFGTCALPEFIALAHELLHCWSHIRQDGMSPFQDSANTYVRLGAPPEDLMNGCELGGLDPKYLESVNEMIALMYGIGDRYRNFFHPKVADSTTIDFRKLSLRQFSALRVAVMESAILSGNQAHPRDQAAMTFDVDGQAVVLSEFAICASFGLDRRAAHLRAAVGDLGFQKIIKPEFCSPDGSTCGAGLFGAGSSSLDCSLPKDLPILTQVYVVGPDYSIPKSLFNASKTPAPGVE